MYDAEIENFLNYSIILGLELIKIKGLGSFNFDHMEYCTYKYLYGSYDTESELGIKENQFSQASSS